MKLYSSEGKANTTFISLVQSLRIEKRTVAHAPLILSALSKGLTRESEISDEVLTQLLKG